MVQFQTTQKHYILEYFVKIDSPMEERDVLMSLLREKLLHKLNS